MHDFSPVRAALSHPCASGSDLALVLFLLHPKTEEHLNSLCRAVSLSCVPRLLGMAQAGNQLQDDEENEARRAAWKRKTKPPQCS